MLKAVVIGLISFFFSLIVDIPRLLMNWLGNAMVDTKAPILPALGKVFLYIFVDGPIPVVATLLSSIGIAFGMWKLFAPHD